MCVCINYLMHHRLRHRCFRVKLLLRMWLVLCVCQHHRRCYHCLFVELLCLWFVCVVIIHVSVCVVQFLVCVCTRVYVCVH